MNTVLIIGAGGVGHVVANKCAQLPDIFQNIHLASRTKSKCDAIAEDVRARTGISITTHAVNADDVDATAALIREVKPQLLINVALPYQDLALMDACLETGVNYLDTANYEPRTSPSSNTPGSGPIRTNSARPALRPARLRI